MAHNCTPNPFCSFLSLVFTACWCKDLYLGLTLLLSQGQKNMIPKPHNFYSLPVYPPSDLMCWGEGQPCPYWPLYHPVCWSAVSLSGHHLTYLKDNEISFFLVSANWSDSAHGCKICIRSNEKQREDTAKRGKKRWGIIVNYATESHWNRFKSSCS